MKSEEKSQRGDTEEAEISQRRRSGFLEWEHLLRASERKLHGAEQREKRPARVNVFEPLPRVQRGSPTGENDVFTQWRTVFNADAEVFANRMADGGLEEQKLERLGAFEPEKIEVCKASHFGSDIEI